MNWQNFLCGAGLILMLFFYIPFRINKFPTSEYDFLKFMQQYNKTYKNDTVYKHHYNNYLNSAGAIYKLNEMRIHNLSAIYGLTKFSDMSREEFKQLYLQKNLPRRIKKRKLQDVQKGGSEELSQEHTYRHKRAAIKNNIPLKIDWRDNKVVTKVNNQKSCGACWAFSTIENMESMYAIKYNKLVTLSVQQAIDCAQYANQGCNGGDDCTFLQWLEDYKIKVYLEKAYPLHLKNEVCKTTNDSFYVQIDKFDCDSFLDQEEYILQAIATIGPVAVAVNAVTWQYYLGGVIQFNCGGEFDLLNHSVQLVGYDLTTDIPYYIVRNSWGEDFGDKGYLYIAVGSNLCGLTNEVSALTVL
ncbi:hypothetical protein FQA39_LY13380 [Lamprigera yunnana]|nr:hypothetical protein FQA39_LY13380 [Lamprigera yunnana]